MVAPFSTSEGGMWDAILSAVGVSSKPKPITWLVFGWFRSREAWCSWAEHMSWVRVFTIGHVGGKILVARHSVVAEGCERRGA